ncbi:MAG TPA: AAA family ATPase [Anaerohalosphaeraceae bacterium]|jgi:SpoVK/Ycf46/Vps4 family AAA+-type ATPase|nr:AAA family ATPase [Anaerohalosphaeraceae bacterium]
MIENKPQTTQPAAPKKASGAAKQSELEVLIRARYPLIYVVSWEEQRVIRQVNQIASQLNKKVFEWSVTMGLMPGGTSIQSQKQRDTASQDPLVALDTVIDHVEPALYVFKDFHPFLRGQNMSVVRRLREIAESLKNTFKTIVMISPMFQLQPELEKDLSIIDYNLPDESDFSKLLDRIVEEIKDNPKLKVSLTEATRERLIHAMLGLTLSEAENVLAKTLVQNRSLDGDSVEVIHSEKKQIIRKSGLLEYYDTQENVESVGGLDLLKDWLNRRALAFTDSARAFGLPAPKGVLLLGVQGCGKSLMAKAISNMWKLPLLRFDVGRVFGSLVGSSEQNIRQAIRVAESVSPAILWLDEIDKAFRGSRSSGASTDGGTSARVFGTFLTWMSEKTHPVFVVATANDVQALPPELLRKGRFDEIFFVDLPSTQERKEIFRVHLARRKLAANELSLEKLALASGGFSGAEIEEVVVSAMFNVFYEKKKIATEDLLKSIEQTVPLSKTMSEDMDALRDWARGRARPATSPEIKKDPDSEKRKLEL